MCVAIAVVAGNLHDHSAVLHICISVYIEHTLRILSYGASKVHGVHIHMQFRTDFGAYIQILRWLAYDKWFENETRILRKSDF